MKVGLAGFMDAEKVTIFHKLTVKEIVFGYNDTFLQFLKSVEDNPMVKSFLDYLKKHDPALYAKIPNINPFIQLQVRLSFHEVLKMISAKSFLLKDIIKTSIICIRGSRSHQHVAPYW